VPTSLLPFQIPAQLLVSLHPIAIIEINPLDAISVELQHSCPGGIGGFPHCPLEELVQEVQDWVPVSEVVDEVW